jgi:hypothetical protein
MNSSEMARRRWQNVPAEARSRLRRIAALAPWAIADEGELAKARSRAATACEVRTRQLAARLLGVDFSSLTGLKVEIIRSSEFRNRKRKEQSPWQESVFEVSVSMIPIDRATAFYQCFLVVTNHHVDGIHFVRGGVLDFFHAHGATARFEFDQILRLQKPLHLFF